MNPTRWHRTLRWIALAGVMALAACAGPQLNVEPIAASADPVVETTRFETEIAQARQEQINVLSPTWFAKAEGSLNEARRLVEKRGEIAAIAENVARGRAELAKAREMSQIARSAISEAIRARDAARAAGATAFERNYAEVEARFLGLTRDIEENDLKSAQRNQSGVAEAYHALEVRAIKENTLGEVRKLLDQAEQEGARKLARPVWEEARKELAETEAFIEQNPYAKEEMLARANAALFKAGRALQITRLAAKLKGMEPVEIALWAEANLAAIADRLGAPDMRDQPYEVQVENAASTAAALVSDRGFLAEKVKTQGAGLERMRREHPAELDALRKAHADELAAVQERHRKEVEELQARRAQEVGELTRKIAALEGKSREEQARIEKMLEEQREAEARAEAERRAELERLEAERRAEAERLAAEKRAAEERLAKEKEFNEKYDRVAALFTPEEAEVYKQGQRLVIRLRGMSFPSGKHVILPENYQLLAKVQKAIREFGSPRVTVEGHTDSVGSLELNNHLSQKRAEAVREYLLANAVVPADQIVAVGYGPTRPLAPNNTEEGRAANRRIDVVIQP